MSDGRHYTYSVKDVQDVLVTTIANLEDHSDERARYYAHLCTEFLKPTMDAYRSSLPWVDVHKFRLGEIERTQEALKKRAAELEVEYDKALKQYEKAELENHPIPPSCGTPIAL